MKILVLTWEYPNAISGGLGVAVGGISKALAQNGHDVDILLPQINKGHNEDHVKLIDGASIRLDKALFSEEKEIVEEIKTINFSEVLLPYLPPQVFEEEVSIKTKKKVLDDTPEYLILDKVGFTGGYDDNLLLQTRKFAYLALQVCNKKDYDFIHCHDWPTFLAGLNLQKKGCQTAFHVHSLEIDRNTKSPIKEIMALEKDTLAKAKRIIAVSRKVKTTIINEYGTAGDKISVIPNGSIEASLQKGNDKGTMDSKLKIGFVGRFTPQKGPLSFLDIALHLKSKGIEADFTMVGDGYMMDDVKTKIDKLNLRSDITITGFLPQKETIDLMASFDLMILPSLAEPFGMTALEAIQLKVPVITTPNGGLSEFVPSLVQKPIWDMYGIGQSAYDLLFDKEKRNKIIGQCLKEASNLTWSNTAKSISKLIDNQLNK